MKVYAYSGCGTCRKARKWLDEHGVVYTEYAIRERPPSKKELKDMLGYLDGQVKKLLNTSSKDYREMGLKDRLANGMTDKEVIDLLSTHGNLIKRPFVMIEGDGTVGFKPDVWREKFAS